MREAFATLGIRVAGAGLAFALQALLARLMTQDDYGGFVMVWTWILALGSFASLGLAEVALRLLPRYAARLRVQAVRGFFNHGFRTTASVATLLSVLGLTMVQLLYLEDTTRTVVVGVCLGLPFLALEFFLEGVARAMGWFRLTTVAVYIIRPLMISIGIAVLHALGVVLSGLVVSALLAASIAATTFALAMLMRRRLRQLARGAAPAVALRRFWMKQSMPMLLASGLDDAIAYVDVVLVGLMLAPAQAAIYFVAARVLVLANLTQYAFYFVATRRFSLALASGGADAARRNMWQVTGVTVATTMAAVLATVLASPWLLHVFGASYAEATWLVAVLGLAQILRAAGGQAAELMMVAGRAVELTVINAVTLILMIAGLAASISTFGLIGAGFAAAAAFAARSVLTVLDVMRRRGLAHHTA